MDYELDLEVDRRKRGCDYAMTVVSGES